MKKPLIPIVVLLAAAGLYWTVKTTLYNSAHESTDNAQVDGSIVPVLAKVGGFVSQLLVIENQPVKAGDVLVHVDSSEYVMRLSQAQAEYDAACLLYTSPSPRD